MQGQRLRRAVNRTAATMPASPIAGESEAGAGVVEGSGIGVGVGFGVVAGVADGVPVGTGVGVPITSLVGNLSE